MKIKVLDISKCGENISIRSNKEIVFGHAQKFLTYNDFPLLLTESNPFVFDENNSFLTLINYLKLKVYASKCFLIFLF